MVAVVVAVAAVEAMMTAVEVTPLEATAAVEVEVEADAVS